MNALIARIGGALVALILTTGPSLAAAGTADGHTDSHADNHTDHNANCSDLLQHQFPLLHDVKSLDLCKAHRGDVILVVNTASQCGFTPQLEGLEALYQRYRERGFVVLGFPSNDFHQELDGEREIASFCRENYGVTFPMFGKSSVRGDDANPLYRRLIDTSGTAPKWNFYKYLVDRDGKVVAVYSSRTTPEDDELVAAIESLLKR